MIEVGVIIDYVVFFGMFVFIRVYVDWFFFVNVEYCLQFVVCVVDFVQLFFVVVYVKNGVDIWFVVDVVEDMFCLFDFIYVVIVVGDSDYVLLVQCCKCFGCYVIGVGVFGLMVKLFVVVCDEFEFYDLLFGVVCLVKMVFVVVVVLVEVLLVELVVFVVEIVMKLKIVFKCVKVKFVIKVEEFRVEDKVDDQEVVMQLFECVLCLGYDKVDVDEWLYSFVVKIYMCCMDLLFSEKVFGYCLFFDFLKF